MKGENKIQFEKWLPNNNVSLALDGETIINGITHFNPTAPIYFYRMPFEMQIGVYLAYYDSLGIFIEVTPRYNSPMMNGTFMNGYTASILRFDNKRITHQNTVQKIKYGASIYEAYQEAFNQADEIINEQLANKTNYDE